MAYDDYGGFIYGLARRVTANAEAAQDITQDVFVRLWERPELVDLTLGSLHGLLGAMCHRRSVDYIRCEQRRRARETKAAQRPEPQTDLGEVVAIAERANQVRCALGRLPASLRIPLMLAYFDGLSYRQVAIRLDIPEGTAKSRLRRALGELHDVLANEIAIP
jgi:RNA polymerase sigma-70 factor, ECF subfamily